MSATINIDLFSNYFDDAPVVKVPGRIYPIDLQYRPIKLDLGDKKKMSKLDPQPYIRILQLIDKKVALDWLIDNRVLVFLYIQYPSKEHGDVLIFLSGFSEIMAVVEAAKQYAQQTGRWIILPLHSALSIEQQDKVFCVR